MKRLAIVFLSVLISVFNVLIAAPVRAAGENLVANPSVETSSNSSTPSSWSVGGWGSNTRTFEYLNTGHAGGKSVKTTISGYSNGDAKWYFSPVSVTAGTEYTFSDYYQANLSTGVIAQITKQDGTNSYLSLGTVPASANWGQASFNFVAPAGAQKATIFHVVAGNGWLVIDDASLAQVAVAPQ